jgi:hypothetical protein
MPPEVDLLTRIREDNVQALREQPELRWLRSTLLGLGGQEVRLIYEPDLDLLEKRGQVWRKAIMRPGPHRGWCHANAALAHQADRSLRLCTGWALSPIDESRLEDAHDALQRGIWVQHSWTLAKYVIEPTHIPRAIYFGFVMTAREARRFCQTVQLPDEDDDERAHLRPW